MMVRLGDADGFIAGRRAALPGHHPPGAAGDRHAARDVHRVSGLYVLVTKKEVYFFADTTVNIEPTAEDLAEIAVCWPPTRRANSTSSRAWPCFPSPTSAARSIPDAKSAPRRGNRRQRAPELDGGRRNAGRHRRGAGNHRQDYPFSSLRGGANVLVFPTSRRATSPTSS